MVTTGLIRRNCPWLLGLKISPCSGEGGDALDKKKHNSAARHCYLCFAFLISFGLRPAEALQGAWEQLARGGACPQEREGMQVPLCCALWLPGIG